jgi:prevent-host-death family protein
MVVITAAKARANFELLMEQVAEHHEPALILCKRTNAVLVSEEDWETIQQILYSEARSKTPAAFPPTCQR